MCRLRESLFFQALKGFPFLVGYVLRLGFLLVLVMRSVYLIRLLFLLVSLDLVDGLDRPKPDNRMAEIFNTKDIVLDEMKAYVPSPSIHHVGNGRRKTVGKNDHVQCGLLAEERGADLDQFFEPAIKGNGRNHKGLAVFFARQLGADHPSSCLVDE